MFSQAKETSENQQPGSIERSAVHRRERVQVEEAAQRIRGLACDLCPGKPLGKKRCTAKGVFALTATRDHSNPSKHSEPGFHLYQSTSRRNGRFEKSGPQSIGRTRGGWNTIIWLPHLTGMG